MAPSKICVHYFLKQIYSLLQIQRFTTASEKKVSFMALHNQAQPSTMYKHINIPWSLSLIWRRGWHDIIQRPIIPCLFKWPRALYFRFYLICGHCKRYQSISWRRTSHWRRQVRRSNLLRSGSLQSWREGMRSHWSLMCDCVWYLMWRILLMMYWHSLRDDGLNSRRYIHIRAKSWSDSCWIWRLVVCTGKSVTLWGVEDSVALLTDYGSWNK